MATFVLGTVVRYALGSLVTPVPAALALGLVAAALVCSFLPARRYFADSRTWVVAAASALPLVLAAVGFATGWFTTDPA